MITFHQKAAKIVMHKTKRLAALVGASLLALTGTSFAQTSTQPQQAPVSATSTSAAPLSSYAPTCTFKDGEDAAAAFTRCSRSSKPVDFKDYKSYDDLIAQHPELADLVKAQRAGDQLIQSVGQVAVINKDLVLFYSNSDGNCGTLGCGLIAFSRAQDDFYPSLTVLGMLPVRYVERSDTAVPSLLICNPNGEQYEWTLGDRDQFDPVPLKEGQSPLPCTAPTSK